MIQIGRFGVTFLSGKHDYNVLGSGVRGNLESCSGVTNIIKFKRRLIHEIFRVGDFTILDVMNLISGPFLPGLRLINTGVRRYNVLKSFFQ